MSSYKDRLNNLKKSWEKDKAVTGAPRLPAGKYQFEIKRAVLEESKFKYNLGHLQVTYDVMVITGPHKGAKARIIQDLETPADNAKNWPSGMSRWKGHLETLKIDMPKSLDDKSIKATLASMIGVVFNGACVINKNGYPNIYINDLVNAPSESDGDEDEVEDEDETEEDTETEETSEDETEDDEDSDDEDDEDDEDEEEELAEKPNKKQQMMAQTLAKATPPSKKPAPDKAPTKKPKKEEDDDDWDSEFDEK